MPDYDSRPETQEHIDRVRWFMQRVLNNLAERMSVHDASKLVEPELAAFDIATPKLAGLEYGSEEYKQSLRDLGPALEHHYAENDHHPEHGSPGIEWSRVTDFPNYEISNYGDVRNEKETILRAHVTPKGYLRIQLVNKEGSRNFMVHRLVANAFVVPSPGRTEVNHKDGVKSNNVVGNLEWVTPSENLIHAYENGLREAEVKYVVHCLELGITTFGCQAMERAVRELGYDRVTAAGIWGAMDRSGKHFDLSFEGTLLQEWKRDQICGMSLMALIEMLCDWRAASERVKQRTDDPEKMKTFESGLTHNFKRFGIEPQLAAILLNTARELGMDK